MNEKIPPLRRDLEFFPVQQGGQQLILIRDHLGLVQEGKAIGAPLYQLMILFDGTRTVRDIQMDLIRQRGGVLVGMDEVKAVLDQLDESYLLDSERFHRARKQIQKDFVEKKTRPCSHCGSAYPNNPEELAHSLEEVLKARPLPPETDKKIKALVSPHIDLSVGQRVYSAAYQVLRHKAPSRILLLGVGHQMMGELFCITDKAFETPLGTVASDKSLVHELREAGRDIIAANDFPHRSEHSLEFQLLFLQHLLGGNSFTIIPILCGSLQSTLGEYSRDAYLQKAGPFLETLSRILEEGEEGTSLKKGGKETLLVAGVDFSHIGPKFGHQRPANYIRGQSEAHDQKLLGHLSRFEADSFWEESARVEDQFHVCGFSALACLLEVLPPCHGEILDYQVWNEEATQSAVSFAAVMFTEGTVT